MTRIVFRNSRGLRLVGLLRRAAPERIVIMAHGFTNDKHSDGRFDYIANCLRQAGWSSLAFDFSGCGESDDDGLTAAKQVDDLRAAVAFVKAQGYATFALWGNSLGARICLEANPPGVGAMILTGAGTGPMAYDWPAYFSAAQMAELEEHGRLTVEREDGSRRQVVVEAQMLQDFAEVDQEALLGAVRCPVLLIHGDSEEDEEELALLAHSRRGLKYLPAGSRIEVLPGARHGFYRYIDQVIELGLKWLETHLSGPAGA